jgi:hypothetical protein
VKKKTRIPLLSKQTRQDEGRTPPRTTYETTPPTDKTQPQEPPLKTTPPAYVVVGVPPVNLHQTHRNQHLSSKSTEPNFRKSKPNLQIHRNQSRRRSEKNERSSTRRRSRHGGAEGRPPPRRTTTTTTTCLHDEKEMFGFEGEKSYLFLERESYNKNSN